MTKDKEWLKEELNKGDNLYVDIEEVLDLIEQMDEPEKLSEEWIYKHAEHHEYIGYVGVPVDDLKNLLVPKQEKPTIPQFVADWIEEERATIIDWHTEIPERFFLILGHKLHYTTLANTNISDWVFGGNEEKLYQALKYGYEVEKEKLYHVVNKENYFMLRKYDGLVDILHVSSSMSRDEYGKDTRFMLTEKEIKDYDKRYWAFAEEVTE